MGEFFSIYSLFAFLLYGGGVYATIKTDRPELFTEVDFGEKIRSLKNKIRSPRKKEEDLTVEKFFKDEIVAPVEKLSETAVEEVKEVVEDTRVSVEKVKVQAVDNINEVKKRVASTKEGEIEKAKRLQKIMEEEKKSFLNSIETAGNPIVAKTLENSVKPKRKGFVNRVKRITIKIVMPWRKFSDIQ